VDSAPATRRHGVNFQSLWGILVTTSGFGKAPFDFANDKPLELLSVTNLLYLLKEHARPEVVPSVVGFGWGLDDGSYGQAVTARSSSPGSSAVARSSAAASAGSS
jgi:hypothetical protein